MSRATFAEAMRAGAEAAWDGDWERAIAAYQQAVTLSPRDMNALMALGLAYFNAGRLEAALETYQRAREVAPEHATVLERLGDTYERLGRMEAAVEAYLAAANSYLHEPERTQMAVVCWRNVIRICPAHLQAHVHLFQHYRQAGHIEEAIAECLTLARLYQEKGHQETAVRLCRYALHLAPRNADVRRQVEHLLGGKTVEARPEPGLETTRSQEVKETAPVDEVLLDAPRLIDIEVLAASSEDFLAPIVAARQQALTELAQCVFDEQVENASGSEVTHGRSRPASWIGRAIDYQARGEIQEALSAYERALSAGANYAGLRFNLGLLYLEQGRLDDAIAQFKQVGVATPYRLASALALEECYRAKGQTDLALECLVHAVETADLTLAQPARIEELQRIYLSLFSSWTGGAPVDGDTVRRFFALPGWEERARRLRELLDWIAQDGPAITLLEVLVAPEGEQVITLMTQTREYAERRLFYTAMEECFYAIQKAPTVLPVHRLLARLLEETGRKEDALAKLVAVADTYQVRGDVEQAVALLQYVLRRTPMDTAVRSRLAALFASHGRTDEALEQYMALAENYYQMAQLDQACEAYQTALRIAPLGDPEQRWEVKILHRLGDLHLQRVEWKQAIAVYERIRDLAPEDEAAHLTLVRLYYHMDYPERAAAELDTLLGELRRKGRVERAIAVLEELVQEHQTDMGIVARLARAYLSAGLRGKAIGLLDRVGRLQLRAGRYREAVMALKALIALNPPNAAEYQRVLERLSERLALRH